MAEPGPSSAKTFLIATVAILGAIMLGILFFLSDLGGAIGNWRK